MFKELIMVSKEERYESNNVFFFFPPSPPSVLYLNSDKEKECPCKGDCDPSVEEVDE